MENFPGLEKPVGGMEFAMKLENQAKKFGADIRYEEVSSINVNGVVKEVITEQNIYQSQTVILAMGANPRKLMIPGEEHLIGLGVSYCATCDGMLFKGKDVIVVGGGDTAAEDAIYLSRLCRKVYLIHRRDKLRAAKILSDKIIGTPNVEVIWNSVAKEIHGINKLESVTLTDIAGNSKRNIIADGLFVAIGYNPSSEILKGIVTLSDDEYIISDENMKTNIQGVFAAGDIRFKQLRQVVTACADGAIAAQTVERYILNH
jgi:thioredoxin reductase (NADPH)